MNSMTTVFYDVGYGHFDGFRQDSMTSIVMFYRVYFAYATSLSNIETAKRKKPGDNLLCYFDANNWHELGALFDPLPDRRYVDVVEILFLCESAHASMLVSLSNRSETGCYCRLIQVAYRRDIFSELCAIVCHGGDAHASFALQLQPEDGDSWPTTETVERLADAARKWISVGASTRMDVAVGKPERLHGGALTYWAVFQTTEPRLFTLGDDARRCIAKAAGATLLDKIIVRRNISLAVTHYIYRPVERWREEVQLWCREKRAFVAICFALGALSLPDYVLLWILQQIPLWARQREIHLIGTIRSVYQSVRRIELAREDSAKKAKMNIACR